MKRKTPQSGPSTLRLRLKFSTSVPVTARCRLAEPAQQQISPITQQLPLVHEHSTLPTCNCLRSSRSHDHPATALDPRAHAAEAP
eukprot:150977-Prorocentrum_lima.AAC.1